MSSKLFLITGFLLLLQPFAHGTQAGPALTIYNSNVALVCEQRSVQLAAGVQEVVYADVAAMLDPSSVQITSVTSPKDLSLLQQRFAYDVANAERLLECHINKDIIISMTQSRSLTGTLLGSTGSDAIVREQDGTLHVIKSSSIQSIHFPTQPAGLVMRPTLIWSIACSKPGVHEIETSYLTQGISWQAEYVATLNPRETQIILQGWASIENRSGKTFQNADLRLVAGDMNRTPQVQFIKRATLSEMARAPAPQEQFEEKQFFEYHIYGLQRPATLRDMETQQIALLTVPAVDIEKLYTFDGQRDGKSARVRLQYRNDPDAGLTLPLPAGRVRIYKKDADGSTALVGEDLIGHTPVGEKLQLQAGKAFDIVGERTVKEVKQISQNSRRETIEIRLRNRRQDDITVSVIEHFTGSWELMGNTPPIKNRSARTVDFEVAVPRRSEKTIAYTVIYTY